METLELAVSAFTQRTRSLVVRHNDTSLTRGLEPHEWVEVRDEDRSWIAVVRDIDFELTDTVYRLELGPVSAPTDCQGARPVTTGEIAAMLRTLGSRPAKIRRAT